MRKYEIREVDDTNQKYHIIDDTRIIDDTWKYDPFGEELMGEDNIRLYLPLNLNRSVILRRLEIIVYRFGEATEKNESEFGIAVDKLVEQMEIYDAVWKKREGNGKKHSNRGKTLAADFIEMLREIPDGCAECFPFELIEGLEDEYF